MRHATHRNDTPSRKRISDHLPQPRLCNEAARTVSCSRLCASSPKRARRAASSVHCCRRSATHLWRNAGPGINYPDRPDLRLRSYAYSRSEAQKWVRLPRCFGEREREIEREREREREREGERERKRESSSRQGFVSALLAEPAHRCRTVEALPGERAQNPVMPGSSSALARARRAFHRCRRSLQQ